MARGAGFDFEAFLVEFMYSSDATRTIERWCNRFGLQHQDVDDARHFWFIRLVKTSRRGTMSSGVVDEESARRYALRAIRNAVVDLARRTKREGAWPDWDEPPDPPPSSGEDADGCEAIRAVISRRFEAQMITCDGCRPEVVVGLALYVVNSMCSGDAETADVESMADELRGGTDPFDRLLYQALMAVTPERIEFDDAGRVAPRSRTFKRRCDPCVRDVIADAVAQAQGGAAA